MRLDSRKEMGLYQVSSSLRDILIDPSLSKINLANQELGSQGIENLYVILQNRKQLHRNFIKINSINLRNTKLTMKDLSILEKILSQEPNCWLLDISENNFGNNGIDKIFAMLIKTQVKIIYLQKISANSMNVKTIYDLIQQNKTLCSIDITSNEFPDNQIQELKMSIANLRSQVEMIFSVNISDVKALKRANPATKTKRENLALSDIDAGWKKNRVVDENDDDNANGLEAKRVYKKNEIDKSIIKCRNLILEHQGKILKLTGYKSFEEVLQDNINNNETSNRRTDCRAFKGPFKVELAEIFYDSRFPVHPIVQLSSGAFLCEAPSPNNDFALSSFCQELMNDKLTQVKNLLVIGDPDQGKKYYDYFSKEQLSVFNYTLKTSFKECKSNHILLRELSIETKIDGVFKKTLLNLYNIRARYQDDYLFLEDDDKKALYQLALTLEPKTIIAHCDIGIGLSAMILFSFHLFRNFTDIFVGETTKITEKILQILTEWRKSNSGILPTKEFAKQAIQLAFEYMDIHCKELIAGNVLKRIHNFADVKTIALLGNAVASSVYFNYLATELRDLGINVYIINLSLKKSENENHSDNFKQVLEVQNDNFMDNNILTNLVAVSARRILARLVESGEVDGLIAVDKEVPRGVLPAVLKDQKVPSIYLIQSDTHEDVRKLITEGVMVLPSTNGERVVSAVSGLLRKKCLTLNSTSSQKSRNNIIFWSPLQCYKFNFINQCEQDVIRTGYEFHKFVSTDENANKEFEYLYQDNAIQCIIEMPNIELVGVQCKYISKPLKHAKPCSYVMIIAGCDTFESDLKFAKREKSEKNNYFQYETTLEENTEIGKGIADRILQLRKTGNKVDVLIPARPCQWQEAQNWDALIRPIQQGVTSEIIHQSKYPIDDHRFYLEVLDLACLRKTNATGSFFIAKKAETVSSATIFTVNQSSGPS